MKGKQIKIGSRKIWAHKAVISADFGAESVLCNDPWLFVELWLKRNNKDKEALAFWQQARRFADAAKPLSVEAAPLPLYYSLLNASKALLKVRASHYSFANHGVSGERPEGAKASLANEKVSFKSGGVLPAICRYFGDIATEAEYDLKKILWNLPYVHRAYRHTFSSAAELFIPIERACYVSRDDTSKGWFEAEVVPRYADRRILRSVPASFEVFEDSGKVLVRRKKRFRWYQGRSNSAEKQAAVQRLCNYHGSLRRVVVPISGTRDLWYLKKQLDHNELSERHTIPLIFAGMHRLSELSRYDPAGLERHLAGQSNWLLSEFIEHSAGQFIDHIASEITGFQFWQPGIRS